MTQAKEWQDLGARLRAAREYCGFSQKEVADYVGIPRTAVSQMESGSRGVDSLELTKLAQLYQRSVNDLLGKATSSNKRSIDLVARAAAGLSKADRDEVVRFAEFLKDRRRGGHDK